MRSNQKKSVGFKDATEGMTEETKTKTIEHMKEFAED